MREQECITKKVKNLMLSHNQISCNVAVCHQAPRPPAIEPHQFIFISHQKIYSQQLPEKWNRISKVDPSEHACTRQHERRKTN
jgi:hypothetical protein